jgi:hypothetical protein
MGVKGVAGIAKLNAQVARTTITTEDSRTGTLTTFHTP